MIHESARANEQKENRIDENTQKTQPNELKLTEHAFGDYSFVLLP